MGWSVLIIIFGIGIVIPAAWSIVGLSMGNTKFWPGVLGTGWAIGLLLVALVLEGVDRRKSTSRAPVLS